ncbi:hypothetical protein ACFLV2_02135 [Chloroflexota bacterium]
MNIKLPVVVTQEHVSSFINNYGSVVDLGILLSGAKIMQKVAPDVLGAIIASMANTLTDNKEVIRTNGENAIIKQPHEEKFITPNIQQASISPNTQLSEEQLWQKIITPPCTIVIPGKKGGGKSGLGYRLLEIFRYVLNPYVLGFPAQAQKVLPEWIGIARNFNEIPPYSIVLIDEAYLRYHSRDSLSPQSKEISRLVNLSRQRNLTLVFVTPETRQVDKNIISQANVIIFKEPSMLQLKFDRKELNNIAEQAKLAFNDLNGDKRKWSYVYSEDTDFMGLVDNSLPTFWSTELSHAFAISDPIMDERLPKKPSKAEKIARAKELHQNHFSYRDIGKKLGINEGTAYNYVNDYPYRK